MHCNNWTDAALTGLSPTSNYKADVSVTIHLTLFGVSYSLSSIIYVIAIKEKGSQLFTRTFEESLKIAEHFATNIIKINQFIRNLYRF